MSKSAFAIAFIWFYFVADAMMQGISLPSSGIVNSFPTKQAAPIMLTVPYILFLLAPFFQRKKETNLGFVSKFFDSKFGLGSTKEFIRKLKPLMLFMVAMLTLGISGTISTFFSTKDMSAYIISGFFLSGGLGLLTAFLLSLKFHPKLN